MPSTCRQKPRWGSDQEYARWAGCPPHPLIRALRNLKTYFVTLKIRNNLRARNTLIPKDVPGFMTAQMTSKMLPMMTYDRDPSLKVTAGLRTPTHSQGLNQVHPAGNIYLCIRQVSTDSGLGLLEGCEAVTRWGLAGGQLSLGSKSPLP